MDSRVPQVSKVVQILHIYTFSKSIVPLFVILVNNILSMANRSLSTRLHSKVIFRTQFGNR